MAEVPSIARVTLYVVPLARLRAIMISVPTRTRNVGNGILAVDFSVIVVSDGPHAFFRKSLAWFAKCSVI
jgi:hypothetical protein